MRLRLWAAGGEKGLLTLHATGADVNGDKDNWVGAEGTRTLPIVLCGAWNMR